MQEGFLYLKFYLFIYLWGGIEVNKKGLYVNSISQQDLNKLLDMLKIIRYGSVTLVIQDGKVVQIEKSEKVRLV
nr:YezD family protein [Clostridium algifaecis]